MCMYCAAFSCGREPTMKTVTILVVTSSFIHLRLCECFLENRWSSFDKEGLSTYFDQRVFRNVLSQNDCIFFLTGKGAVLQFDDDWWDVLEENNRWANYPGGYFLQGFVRSAGGKPLLTYIEEGKCTKSGDHPNYYGHCYNQGIELCFDAKNVCSCNENYFVTGNFRTCDALHCFEKLCCCKMTSSPEILDELSKVKI